MHIDQQKQQFSFAFVHAVATVAGYSLYDIRVDDDSIDCGIAARGGENTTRKPRLEAQLKCTSRDLLGEETLNFPLKTKNYDDLRADSIVPRILVVVTVPEDVNLWLDQTEDQLTIKHCAYWVSLAGRPESGNIATVTINIPRTAQFTVRELQSMMARINQGATL